MLDNRNYDYECFTWFSQLWDSHVLHFLEVSQNVSIVPGGVPCVAGPAVVVMSETSHHSHVVDAAGTSQNFTSGPSGTLAVGLSQGHFKNLYVNIQIQFQNQPLLSPVIFENLKGSQDTCG